MKPLPRIAITPGEPAGIGPDLTVMLAQQAHNAQLVAFADGELLKARAEQLGLPLTLRPWRQDETVEAQTPGMLWLAQEPLATNVECGKLNPANAKYFLNTLDAAANACLHNELDALVTGPAQKSVVNDAGIAFSGHTEYLADLCEAPLPVMMLATEGLRVALVTTHLPLKDVAEQITVERVRLVLDILLHDLHSQFGIKNPRVLVCGLNPHAGEDGHLGTEDRDVIAPVINEFKQQGHNVTGPLPADTLFTPKYLDNADAVLAVYHDQGLPVLKFKGFGNAINVTLGLPIIRTSVDHGTALDLAGTGKANVSSMELAVNTAIDMVKRHS